MFNKNHSDRTLCSKLVALLWIGEASVRVWVSVECRAFELGKGALNVISPF